VIPGHRKPTSRGNSHGPANLDVTLYNKCAIPYRGRNEHRYSVARDKLEPPVVCHVGAIPRQLEKQRDRGWPKVRTDDVPSAAKHVKLPADRLGGVREHHRGADRHGEQHTPGDTIAESAEAQV
jgi:hypothetical protein